MRVYASLVSSLIYLLLLSSCEQFQFEEDNSSGESTSVPVRIITRAENGVSLPYPIHVYAFSASGALLAQQDLQPTESSGIQMTLPQGSQCRLVAVAADESVYDLPERPTLSSVITMKAPTLSSDYSPTSQDLAQGFSTSSPLQMGWADLVLSGNSATASIQMYYQVASINVSITNFPAQCEAAYISVTTPQSGITFGGSPSGTQTARIPLNPLTWSTGEVYVFPTTGNQTNFTIAYNDAEGEVYASVSYLSPLKAGTPYVLNGTCISGDLQVTGSVTSSTWNAPVNLDFAFSPDSPTVIQGDDNSSGNGEPSTPGDENTYTVTSIPTAPCLWEGHIVASSTPDEDGQAATLLLMSLRDEGGLTSAFNTSSPTTAFTTAQEYAEYAIASWRIPTEEEATILRNAYVGDPDKMDALIEEAQGSAVVLTDDKGNNLRYLCADAEKTFSFKQGSSYNSIKSAGATVKTYRLRLVTTVRVALAP